MTLPGLNIPALLKRYHIKPDKRLGQNFLIDPDALERVVQVSNIGMQDTVLEVGAGVGNLTRLLAIRSRNVIAVELDDRLIPPLEEVTASLPNVLIVHADILQLDPAGLIDQPGYAVVANIPYYITSALIRHLLEAKTQPGRLTLTVQREVAQRICAEPGDMSLLSLSVQVYGNPSIAAQIPAGAFYPKPKVDSAVVKVDLFPSPLIPVPLLPTFFRLAKAGFSQKRKTLRNALSGGMRCTKSQTDDMLLAAGIDPGRRAQTLSLAEWKDVTSKFVEQMD
jgi:16S rRNA (adenine1518-N6/adenine1519-N6)-dimethyltransferase